MLEALYLSGKVMFNYKSFICKILLYIENFMDFYMGSYLLSYCIVWKNNWFFDFKRIVRVKNKRVLFLFFIDNSLKFLMIFYLF